MREKVAEHVRAAAPIGAIRDDDRLRRQRDARIERAQRGRVPRRHLAEEDVLPLFTPEERLQGMEPEQRLAGLSPQQIAELLSAHRDVAPPPPG